MNSHILDDAKPAEKSAPLNSHILDDIMRMEVVQDPKPAPLNSHIFDDILKKETENTEDDEKPVPFDTHILDGVMPDGTEDMKDEEEEEVEEKMPTIESPPSMNDYGGDDFAEISETSRARKARARRRYISAPTNLSLTPTDTTVTIGWTASTGLSVTGYIVLRNGVEVANIASTDPLSFEDTGLAPATQYTYSVYAYNEYQGTSGMATGVATTATP